MIEKTLLRSILTYQEARERMDRKLLKLKELESIKVTFENGKELSKKIYQVKKSIRLLQRNYYEEEFF